MNQVEEVAGEAREPGRNYYAQGGAQCRRSQGGQVLAEAAGSAAAELDFALAARVALLAKRRDRLAEVADV